MSTIEHSAPAVTPVTAVRITPTYPDGTPDHRRATAHRFETPAALAYVHRTATPPITEPLHHDRTLPPLLALLAPDDHPETDTLHAIDRGIWWHGAITITVELWSEPAGTDYLLIPRWRRIDSSDDPRVELPHHRTHTVGEALRAEQPLDWPRLDPTQAAYAVQAGVSMLLTSDTPPPPDTVRTSPGHVHGRAATHA
ncbi:hypothetical protein ACWF2L_30490 [Streptomyces anulatus]